MANFMVRINKIGNTKFFVLIALREISPGEHLCWNYGLQYFQRKTLSSPYLLMKTGEIVPQECFHWKNPMVVFYDADVEHTGFKPIPVSDFVENHGIFNGLRDNSPYSISIYYTYFTHDPSFNARISQQLYTFIPCPTVESPDVKFMTEQQMDELSSPSADSVLMAKVLGKEYRKDEWTIQKVIDNQLTIRPQATNFFVFIGDHERKEIIRRELREARIAEKDILTVNEEILVSKRGPFSAITNCKAYNLEQAYRIYKPQAPFKWSGNNTWPSACIWLELSTAIEDRDLLTRLAKHINSFLITQREKSSIVVSKHATKGTYVLMIKDAGIMTRNNVPTFQIAVTNLGATIEGDEDEVFDESERRLTGPKS